MLVEERSVQGSSLHGVIWAVEDAQKSQWLEWQGIRVE